MKITYKSVRDKFLKELAEECEGQLSCWVEYTEKYITFSVPIETKVTRINKNGEEITKTISYRAKFIDSATFMASSLSNIGINLTEGIHKIKCTNCNTRSLEFVNAKDNSIE